MTAGQEASRAAGGIACILVGMLFWVTQDGLMKSLLGTFTVWSLICMRAIIAVAVLGPLIALLGQPYRLFTSLWPLHLLRAALSVSGFTLFYTAFPFMGLAEVSTIFFSAPLITALLAALFLGERIGVRRIACLLVGFLGVVVAIDPAGDAFHWTALLPLLSAFFYATSQVMARKIGKRETTLTLGFYTIAFSALLVLPMSYLLNSIMEVGPDLRHVRWDWPLPTWGQLPSLLALAAVGLIGYLLLTRAYQIASASLIGPFEYSYLPFATAMAFLVWGEVPGWHSVIGMLLIVGSGLYLGYREVQQDRGRAELPPSAEAAFVPTAPVGAIAHASDIYEKGREHDIRP
ncbi:MAG: DMT family transporter [Rhodospirillales bacterium]|nr:DMT family transporter [Rhodospirillales bacterium]